MTSEVDINWELLGAKFANLSDNIQAKFFKGLANELKHWDSEHAKEMQFFMVADGLTDKEKEQLEKTLHCLWWKDDNS